MPKTLLFADLSPILAQQSAQASGGPNPILGMAPYILLFVAMYFFLIAPQRKRQKEHDSMVKALGAGDEVILNGGIYGQITAVRDDRFVVRIADNTKVEVQKGFIHARVPKNSEKSDKK